MIRQLLSRNLQKKIQIGSDIRRRLISTKIQLSYLASQPGNFHLVGQTIQDRIDWVAANKPNEIAYKFCATQTSIKFLELKQRVNELAQGFLRLGLQKGDRVAIMLPNVPELILSIYALAQIGCISVLMNPAYNIDEIEYMLKKTNAKCLLLLDNFKTLKHYEILSRLCPELKTSPKGELKSKTLSDLRHVVVVNNKLIVDNSFKYSGVWSFENDLSRVDGSFKSIPGVDFDDTVALLFTSGTTGFPKAAPLTHFAMINSARNCTTYPGTFDLERIACFPIPIFHLFAFIVGMVAAVTNATQTVFPFFVPDTVATMKAIQSERCTTLKGAPTIFFDLIHHPKRSKYDLSSLETVLIGASTVPKELALKIKRELNLKAVIIGYAMTESGCSGLMTRISDTLISDAHAYETIGTPQPYVEIKIVDAATGEIVERGVDGEICIRSYGVMKGYWEDLNKTKETIDENGWLHTGDIGCMRDDGYIVYKSRAKEMVIRGGINIYPAEIERLLCTHASVLDCYVFGVPDERLGEELAVWIKPKPGCEASLNETDIKEFANQHIAAFKVPKYVRFVSSFPVSATGKVQKFKMTQQLSEELSDVKKSVRSN